MRIFGREPTLILQGLSALLGVLVAIGIPGVPLNAEQSALIIALLGGVLGAANAAMVRPIAPAAFTTLVGMGAALAAAYGFEASAEVVGSIQALVVTIVAMATRVQVTPAADPRPVDQVVG